MSLTHYTPPGGPGFLLPLCDAEPHPLAREYVSTDPARVNCPACVELLAARMASAVPQDHGPPPTTGGAA